MSKLKHLYSVLGPGLLYAGAAVGVSHLVQSTRAGADFGFQLVWAIILANLVKYPFFQMGPRYTAATGSSLLNGYRQKGLWTLVVFFFVTLATMFIIQAAITLVTAGLAQELFGVSLDVRWVSALILVICALILFWGRYALLNSFIKFIVVILSIATVLSVMGALTTYQQPVVTNTFSFSVEAHVFFLIALVGWVPAPLDISVWHSIWSEAKNRESGLRTSLKDAMLDFNVGYFGTLLLAVLFMVLGALVMYGSSATFSGSAAKFAGQLITLYTNSLGNWAYPLIAVACFMTMLSTCLTCLDAFPRVLRKITGLLIGDEKIGDSKASYTGWLMFTTAGTVVLLFTLLQDMKAMVDFATTVSFVLAPVVAVLNYVVIQDPHVPAEARLTPTMRACSLLSIGIMTGFSVFYLFYRY